MLNDAERGLISAVTGTDPQAAFINSVGARTTAQRLVAKEAAAAHVRGAFLLDTSTPHSDAVVVEGTVMKPALGWVTVHATEGLRSGTHEWCVKVENHGESTDGSGLMLGLVPRGFSRYDSFVSQGGGWCLSRAGKFYGHWRRVDNNTTTSSLVFGTGDRVIFELDLSQSRLTVRVGDRFVTGELSNVTGEVFPAVSLHYRNQSVKFEYHKVIDRDAKQRSWVERRVFPSAACFLPIATLADALQMPIDHYLFSALLADPEDAARRWSLTAAADQYAAKVALLARALQALSRVRGVGSNGHSTANRALLVDVPTLRAASQSPAAAAEAPSFAGDCAAAVMLQALAVPSAATAMVLATAGTLAHTWAHGRPFAMAEGRPARGGASPAILQQASDTLYSLLTPGLSPIAVAREQRTGAAELLCVLAVQRGLVSDALRCVRVLTLLDSDAPEATMSGRVAGWLADVAALLRPAFALLRLLPTESVAPMAVPEVDSASPTGACFDGFSWYQHTRTGLRHWHADAPPDTAKTAPVTLPDPCADLQWAQRATVVPVGAFVLWCPMDVAVQSADHAATAPPALRLVCLSKAALRPVACVVIASADVADLLSGWQPTTDEAPLHAQWAVRLVQSGTGPAGLPTDGANRFTVIAQRGPCGIPHAKTFELVAGPSGVPEKVVPCSQCAAALRPCLPVRSRHRAIAVARGAYLTLMPLIAAEAAALTFPRGHATVEFSFQLTGRCEPQVLFRAGDRTAHGEVFIDIASLDNVLCLRGGYRHDTRGTHTVSTPLHPASDRGAFRHVALSYNGLWTLSLDGEAAVAKGSRPSIEAPLAALRLQGGVTYAELRVWRQAKPMPEVRRDARRPLRGDEDGLVLYLPLCERVGNVCFDHGPHGFHCQGAVDASSSLDADTIAVPLQPLVCGEAPHGAHPCGDVPIPGRTPSLPSAAAVSAGRALVPDIRTTPFAPVPNTDLLACALPGHTVAAFSPKPLADGTPTAYVRGLHSLVQVGPTRLLGRWTSAKTQQPLQQPADTTMGTLRIHDIPLAASAAGPGSALPRAEPLTADTSLPAAFADVTLLFLEMLQHRAVLATAAGDAGDSGCDFFSPLATDISDHCFWAALGVIRDHHRVVQGRHAPKFPTLRGPQSAVIIETVLGVLSNQLRSVVALGIHGSSLDLVATSDVIPRRRTPTPPPTPSDAPSDASPQRPAAPTANGDATPAARVPRSSSAFQSPSLQRQQSINGTGPADQKEADVKPPTLGDALLGTLLDLLGSEATASAGTLRQQAARVLSQALPILFPDVGQRVAMLLQLLKETRAPAPLACALVDSLADVDANTALLTRPADAMSVPGLLEVLLSTAKDACLDVLKETTEPSADLASSLGARLTPVLGSLQLLVVSAAVGQPPQAVLSGTHSVTSSFFSGIHAAAAGAGLAAYQDYLPALLTAAREVVGAMAAVLSAPGRRSAKHVDALRAFFRLTFAVPTLHAALVAVPLMASHARTTQALHLIRELTILWRNLSSLFSRSHVRVDYVADMHATVAAAATALSAAMASAAPPLLPPPLRRPYVTSREFNEAHGEGNIDPRLAALVGCAQQWRDPLPAVAPTEPFQKTADLIALTAAHLCRWIPAGTAQPVAVAALRRAAAAAKPLCMSLLSHRRDATVLDAVTRVCGALLALEDPPCVVPVPGEQEQALWEGSVSLRKCICRSQGLAALPPLSPARSTAKARWARLRRLLRITRALALMHEGATAPDGPAAVVAEVLTPLLRPEDVVGHAAKLPEQLRAAALFSEARLAGLHGLASSLGSPVALESGLTTVMLVSATKARLASTGMGTGHYAEGILGAAAQATAQRAFYTIVRAATADPMQQHTVADLLGGDLRPNDYGLLAALRIPRRLMDDCSVFAVDSGLLRDEPPAERAHRLAAIEFAKTNTPDASKLASEQRTLREEDRARSWSLLVRLAVHCAHHARNELTGCEGPLASHAALATRAFLDDFFEAVASELDRCAEYTKNFYYPSQERVTEQITAICGVLCTVARLLPERRAYRHSVVCAAQLSAVAAMAMLPAQPPALAEVCLRTAGLLVARLTPAACDSYFSAMVLSAADDFTDAAPTAAFFFAIACRFAIAADGFTSGPSGAALATLAEMAVRPQWAQQVEILVAGLQHHCSTMLHAGDDGRRREGAMRAIATLLVVVSPPSGGVGLGAVVQADGKTLVVVECAAAPPASAIGNSAAATCVCVPLPLAAGTEREVSVDELSTRHPLRTVAGGASRASAAAIGNALRLVITNWSAALSSAHGAIVAMLLLRGALCVASAAPEVVVQWAATGFLTALLATVASKGALSPLPLEPLEELSTAAIVAVLRQLRASGLTSPEAVVPRSVLLQMVNGMDLPATLGHDAAPRSPNSRRLFASQRGKLRDPPAVLLLTSRAARVRIEPPDDEDGPTVPRLTSGLTLELTLQMIDGAATALATTLSPPPAPSVAHLGLHHTIASFADADGRTLLELSIRAGELRFGLPQLQIYATAPLHTADIGRWLHVTAVCTPAHDLLLVKDGDVVASVPHRTKDLLPAIQDSHWSIGAPERGLPSAAGVERGFEPVMAVGGLRLWGFALQTQLIKSIADVCGTDGSLPHASFAESQSLSFRFLEGTGATTLCDSGELVGRLSDEARWGSAWPTDGAAPTPIVEDEEPAPAEADHVPRREWGAFIESLDGQGAASMCTHVCLSLCAHYARGAIVAAIRTVSEAHLRGLTDDLDTATALLRDIMAPSAAIGAACELLRYTPYAPEHSALFFSILERLLGAEPALDTIHALAVSAVDAMRDSQESFSVLLPYTSFPGDHCMPLCAMHGGFQGIATDDGRHMDTLTLFADRSLKAQVVRTPDATGFWADVAFARRGWVFAKPTSTIRFPCATFTVKTASARPAVAADMLTDLIRWCARHHPKSLGAIADHTIVRGLVMAAEQADAAHQRRPPSLGALAALYDAWADCPHLAPNDQTPPRLLLGRLLEAASPCIQRAQAHLLPSRTMPRHVQQTVSCVVAAARAYDAWRGVSLENTCGRLCTLIQDRAVGLCSPAPAVQFPFAPQVSLVKLGQAIIPTTPGLRKPSGAITCTAERYCTVRSDLGVRRDGRAYCEFRLSHSGAPVTVGVVAIGFKGFGLDSAMGQCQYSWCFDGARLCQWHMGAKTDFSQRIKWRGRDVIGLRIDGPEGSLALSLNGRVVATITGIDPGESPLFPAATFGATACEINFGAAPFSFPVPTGCAPLDPRGYFHDASMFLTSAQLLDRCSRGGALPKAALESAAEVICAAGREGPPTVHLFHLSGRQRSAEDGTILPATQPALLRANVAVTGGRWYFEVTIDGDGLLAMGWASQTSLMEIAKWPKASVGDDAESWALDGNRMTLRHHKTQRNLGRHPWRDGDVVGCLLDLQRGIISFFINKLPLRDVHDAHGSASQFTNVRAASGLVPVVFVEANTSGTVAFDKATMVDMPDGSAALSAGPLAGACARALCSPLSSAACTVDPSDLTAIATTHVELVEPGSIVSVMETLAKPPLSSASTAGAAGSGGQLAGVYAHALDALHATVLPFVPLPPPGLLHQALGASLQRLRPQLLPLAGIQHMLAVLEATGETTDTALRVSISRRQALLTRESPPEARAKASVFGQLLRNLGSQGVTAFTTGRRLWSVSFVGEGADDVGGPYRESLALVCEELMSGILPLFVPSPNQSGNVGAYRDRFLFNAEAGPVNTPEAYQFLGRVVGGCLRSGDALSLRLAPSTWLWLTGTAPGEVDVLLDDAHWHDTLRFLRGCVDSKASDEAIQDVLSGGFVAYASDGSEHPLVPGGADLPVTAALLPSYLALYVQHRTRIEGAQAREAFLKGFHSVVPLGAAAGLAWRELEALVCGQPDFSVDRLAANFKFENITPTDARISRLVTILKSFSRTERAAFARFVSGREHLPATTRLKIMGAQHLDGLDDQHLPTASTCFLWVSIPKYSSEAIMREKLLFAITQCRDIDADFRVRDGAAGALASPVVRPTDGADDGEFEDFSHLM